VQRLIRGEDLDVVSRELGVTAAAFSEWRQTFEAAGQAALKSRPPDERDAENLRLKAKIGELTMAIPPQNGSWNRGLRGSHGSG
jgi:transposase-like protein